MNAWLARPIVLATLLVAFALVVASRNLDTFLHPQFWAEDGWIWYPDAYALGVRSFTKPAAGYLQTISRLVAWLVQGVPLAWAPPAFAFVALLMQALPPLVLVSSRMASAWPDARGRVLFALIWLMLPNTREIYVNLTNAQWHLATLAFLVLLSRPPRGWAAWSFDGAILIISGLSGPFCAVLAPVAAWLAWVRRDRASVWRAAAVFAAAAVQGVFVAATIGERTPAALGATPDLLARIVSEQILFGALLGQENMPALTNLASWKSGTLPVLMAALGGLLTAAALIWGREAIRLTALASVLLFAAALARPQITLDGPQWFYMQLPGVGQRYYYIPMLGWLAVLVSLAGNHAWWRRLPGVALLACAMVGIWSDWTIPPNVQGDFATRARNFDAAPPGTVMDFHFPPLFDKAPMRLIKR